MKKPKTYKQISSKQFLSKENYELVSNMQVDNLPTDANPKVKINFMLDNYPREIQKIVCKTAK